MADSLATSIYIPKDVLKQARELAAAERRSVNSMLVILLEDALTLRQHKQPHRIGDWELSGQQQLPAVEG
jgi:hypothetical protein